MKLFERRNRAMRPEVEALDPTNFEAFARQQGLVFKKVFSPGEMDFVRALCGLTKTLGIDVAQVFANTPTTIWQSPSRPVGHMLVNLSANGLLLGDNGKIPEHLTPDQIRDIGQNLREVSRFPYLEGWVGGDEERAERIRALAQKYSR